MKKDEDKVVNKMKRKIAEIQKSKRKAKEVLLNSGIYTKSGKIKRQYQ